jgi:hypothetical protein
MLVPLAANWQLCQVSIVGYRPFKALIWVRVPADPHLSEQTYYREIAIFMAYAYSRKQPSNTAKLQLLLAVIGSAAPARGRTVTRA